MVCLCYLRYEAMVAIKDGLSLKPGKPSGEGILYEKSIALQKAESRSQETESSPILTPGFWISSPVGSSRFKFHA